MAEENKKHQKQQLEEVTLVRILGKDIRGDKAIFAGLTLIQGISWAFANAVCKILDLDKKKKIQEMTAEEIKSLEECIREASVPVFLKNRQKDFETGEDGHISGIDLKLRKEFDIKRLKKIKSYKGVRHNYNLPVRGQRTKANFRKNRKKSGAKGAKK
jgi:small subunit ribosomal protein S13